MFKAFGNFIYKTPWWGVAIFGLFTLIVLVMFATPIHVIRLAESGATAGEKRAIKREIDLAFGHSALNVAEGVIGTMKERSTDPVRKAELARALSEIDRARKDLSKAQAEIGNNTRAAAQEAVEAAHDAARDVAQAAIEAATEAKEAVEEARREALNKLRDKGIDTTATARSFDDLLKSAQEREQAAKEAMQAIKKLREKNVTIDIDLSKGLKVELDTKDGAKAGVTVSVDKEGAKKTLKVAPAPNPPVASDKGAPPKIPAIPAPENGPGVDFDGKIGGTRVKGKFNIGEDGKLSINLPPAAPLPPLAPEFRDDIRSKVAGDVWRIGVGSALILTFIPLFIMLVIAKYLIGRSRRALALADKKTEEAEISNVNRQVTEARLQALQAQVEPHFLYNTLANVQALTEVDPPAANKMVGHLIQYLRSSLPKMRETSSTVGQEVELVRAYLNILKMRMGTRLEFAIEVPDDLMASPFPPMMLPSLVENAIKHGLEPQREGGRIDVVVARIFTADGDRIRLQVKDTGRGLTGAPIQSGGGVGLSNLRERLGALYGDKARFTIESNDPKGVVASIELPATLAAQQAASPSMTPRVSFVDQPPATGWNRVWGAAAKTHSVWTRILSVVFVSLMTILSVLLVIGLIALYSGWLPVNAGSWQLGRMESMALGSVGLLAGFAVAALAAAIVVAVIYGLGFLFVGLLIFIPVVILISMVPALAPFAVVAFVVYWFWWRKRAAASAAKAPAEL